MSGARRLLFPDSLNSGVGSGGGLERLGPDLGADSLATNGGRIHWGIVTGQKPTSRRHGCPFPLRLTLSFPLRLTLSSPAAVGKEKNRSSVVSLCFVFRLVDGGFPDMDSLFNEYFVSRSCLVFINTLYFQIGGLTVSPSLCQLGGGVAGCVHI